MTKGMIDQKPENPPAFPGLHPSKECRYQDAGMTLRDYFAAKAMQGILASPKLLTGSAVSDISDEAYRIADGMLKARTK